MAQSGFTPIKLYLSTTAAAVPTAANLEPGELALNNNDGKLFYEDSSGVVQVIATKAGASGDVVGPASATANAIPSFDGTTGKLIKDNSGATISAGVVTATGFSGPLNGSVGATTPSTVVATQVDITAQGDLRLQDSTGGEYVALQAPATLSSSYTLTLPADDGTSGQALITDGSGVLSWSTAASGDVYGPASATDNAVARYDGTTGKIIQNSAVTIGDDGATVIAANSSSDGLRITQVGSGNALTVEDSANPDATPVVIDSSGRGVFGYTSFLQVNTYSANEPLSVYGASGQGIQIGDFGANQFAGGLNFGKSRSGTIGTGTVVNSGDALGNIIFNGFNGSAYNQAATIVAAVDETPGTNDMPGRLVFSTTADGASSPTERMRIDNAGRVGIGSSSLTGYKLKVGATITGGVNAYGVAMDAAVQSDTTFSASYFTSVATTQATAFTLSNLRHYWTFQNAFGAGSSVTNQFGYFADASLTGATNNYGFYGNIASGTGRWNFYAAGTAANYFAGSLSVGTTNAPAQFTVQTTGTGTTAGSNVISRFQTNGSGYDANIQFSDTVANSVNIGQFGGAFYTIINGVERMRIASVGTISLGAAPGAESLRVTPVASAVNFWNFTGNTAGNAIGAAATGGDTNISLGFTTKGNGVSDFYSNNYGSLQFRVAHTASAVNYLQVTGGSTGNYPYFTSQGSDTNVSGGMYSKGTGGLYFGTASGATNQFVVAHTASAVNYLQVTGGATGVGVALSAQGSDANITNFYSTKGTGPHSFFTGGGNQFVISNTASAVNAVLVSGSATGAAVQVAAGGSDTNIDLALTPKGTGNVRFGTLTATSDVAITGYIEIKDGAGNVRKLAVIS